MTINIRGCWRTYELKQQQKRIETHARLRHELDEERISAQLVDRHNRRVLASQQFRQTGELA